MKNKFIKYLIIINGLLLPIILVIILYQFIKDTFIKDKEYNNNAYGVVVGEELEKAKNKNVAIQGLRYFSTNSIYNSTNIYLPISLMTYDEQKNISKARSSANNLNTSYLKYVNIIFLTGDYQVLGSLLDRKASILEIKPQRKSTDYNIKENDKTVKYIGYLIGYEDTNNDGAINSLDDHDLYLSDLNGKNLKQITTKFEIESFRFIKSNSKILIEYKDRNNLREEHKKKKFAIYDIYSSEFISMDSLDKELDKLEKLIIN